MKTSKIEREIILIGYVLEFGHVANMQIGLDIFFFEFLSGKANRFRGKIYACDLPACPRECDNVGACAATEIYGFACRMSLNKFKEFGRGDTAIPGRLAKIPEIESKTAKHIVGCVIELSLKFEMLVTLTIQMSSFTIMRLARYPKILGRAYQ